MKMQMKQQQKQHQAAGKRGGKIVTIAAGAAAVAMLSPVAAVRAANWTATAPGTYNWTDAGNWDAAVPNAPGAVANLAVPLTGNIAVNVPNTTAPADITVGNLSLGGTGVPVTTDLGNNNLGGGRILFDNTGGANNADGSANAAINSVGTAGAINIISAPVALRGNTNITQTSTNSLTLNGNLIVSGDAAAVTRALLVNLTGSQKLTINGNITSEALATPAANITNILQLSNLNNTTNSQWGDVVINGNITNGTPVGGFNVNTQVIFGAGGANNGNLISTIYLNGTANTYSGGARLFRSNIVLGSNSAFGTGSVQWGSGAASGAMGFNFFSTDDARNITNNMTMQRNLTIKGEHSMTWSGTVAQSNASNFFNLLPAGKTFTFANTVFTDTSGTGRPFTFDGTGTTLVTGAIVDNQANNGTTGNVQKNGDGTVFVTVPGTASNYHGSTVVNGGLLQFADANSYGTTTQMVTNPGGALAVTTGTTAPAVLALFNAATQNSTGALALSAADAAANIDFTSGAFADPHLVGVSLGAASGGINYTGTITPPAAGYRLGGGATITLPNTNQLTGANALSVVNGGTVVLGGTNNLTGNTTVKGAWIATQEQGAAANNGLLTSFIQTGVYEPSTLVVGSIADGASAIGNPTDTTAANLSLSGGTLRINAAGNQSSSRLFTIGTQGATLDSSGAGAVSFTNTGSNVSADFTGSVTGNTTTSGNNITNVSDAQQLAVGMTVSGGNLPAGTTITGIRASVGFTGANSNAEAYTLFTSANAATAATGATLTFGNQNRTLNLTGSNTGANTVAGGLADSAGGKLSVAKTGAGTWVLNGGTAGLTYSGNTTVSAGKLTLGANQTSTSSVNVTGGTLELAAGGGSNRVIRTPSVAVSGGGRLDLQDNKLITATPVGSATGGVYNGVTGMIQSGRNGGGWGGSGIVTSQNAAVTSSFTSLGVASAAQVKGIGASDTAVWAGQTVTGSDTLVMYTYGGDANLDGKINVDDYGKIDSSAPLGIAGWYNGDFNYDGKINVDDYGIIDFNIGIQGAPFPTGAGASSASGLSGVSAVPEPATLSLLSVGAAGLMGRRRRRATRGGDIQTA